MLLSTNLHYSGPTFPWEPSSNNGAIPKRDAASTASDLLSHPNKGLRPTPYISFPPGLDPHPNNVPPIKVKVNSVSSRLRNLRDKGDAVLSAIAKRTGRG